MTSKRDLCIHNRPLSICAVCAPIADEFYKRHQRPATDREIQFIARTQEPDGRGDSDQLP